MSCNKCCCSKVVFSGSSNATQALGLNDTLAFNKNISANVDFANNSVTLCKPGIYLVNVSASGSMTGTTADNIIIQLQRNGVNVDGAYRSVANSTATTDIVNLSITGIIRVDETCCPLNDQSATITVANTGAEATYVNVTITVVRL